MESMVGSITTYCVVVSYSFIAIVSVFRNQRYFTVDGLIHVTYTVKIRGCSIIGNGCTGVFVR